jgi:tRNA(His) 5'-end guanylyltransferase
MTDKTSIGDRMKRYEEVPRTSLTPRMPMIVRVDGRAFHTFTRGFERPWSVSIRDAMTEAASALMREVSGVKIAYLQSDEISLLVTDYDSLSTVPWFQGVAQKICSVTASIATAAFNSSMFDQTMSGGNVEANTLTRTGLKMDATFDSRCFAVPREDVTNYFVWRQRDAEKNSVSMLAQSHFSHNQLQGKSGSAKQDMLMLEKGVNWNDLDVWKKRGWCVIRETREVEPGKLRTFVEPVWDIPIFTKERDYIERHVNIDLKEEESIE